MTGSAKRAEMCLLWRFVNRRGDNHSVDGARLVLKKALYQLRCHTDQNTGVFARAARRPSRSCKCAPANGTIKINAQLAAYCLKRLAAYLESPCMSI
jgi:hypothetical protein